MGLQRYPLGGFLGGMNLVDNPYALENDEAQRAINVDLGIRDVLNTRKGYSEGGLASEVKSQKKFPGKITQEEGIDAWVNPNNAKAEDAAYATNKKASFSGEGVSFVTKRLKAEEFAFVLPANAVIIGAVMGMKGLRVETNPFSYSDICVFQLLKEGALSGEETPGGATLFGLAAENHSVGGPEKLLGNLLVKADVEKTNFGFRFYTVANYHPNEAIGGGSCELKLDDLWMEIYYLVPGAAGDVIDHMRPWYVKGQHYLILSTNGKIKVLKGGKLETLITGTAGTVWDFEAMEYNAGTGFEDFMWCMNGVDAPRVINSSLGTAEWKGATKKVPQGSMLRTWKTRMLIAGDPKHPQRLYESEPFNPLLPDDETNGGYGTNYNDIGSGEDDIDPIIWLEILDDVLLVFKKKSVWAVYEDKELAAYRIANVGAEGRFLSCVSDDRCYFTNRSGIYSVTAEGSPRYESLNVEPLFKAEGPADLGVGIHLERLGAWGRMSSLPNGRVYLAYSPTGGLLNEYMLELYPRLRGASKKGDERTPIVIHNFALRTISSMCTFRLTDSEVDKIVAGLTNTSGGSPELVRLFYSERDGVEPISWRWLSGKKPEISQEPFERIRRVNVLMTGKIQSKTFSDAQAFGPVTLETANQEMLRYRPETWGRYHSVEFFDVGQTSSSIYAVELGFRGGKEHT